MKLILLQFYFMKYMPSQIPLTNIYNTDGVVKGDAGVLANAESLEDLMVFNIDAPFASHLVIKTFSCLNIDSVQFNQISDLKKNAI